MYTTYSVVCNAYLATRMGLTTNRCCTFFFVGDNYRMFLLHAQHKVFRFVVCYIRLHITRTGKVHGIGVRSILMIHGVSFFKVVILILVMSTGKVLLLFVETGT